MPPNFAERFDMDSQWLLLVPLLLCVTVILIILIPRLGKLIGPRFGAFVGKAYQQRFFNQLKKKFPLLSERLDGFEMSAERQAAFQAAVSRIPPQEGQKLQTEFNRLREKFMERHPELNDLLMGTQEPRAQMKSIDKVMKLPAPQREAIEKDLLWAWDQLRGRFPKWVGALESVFRKKTTTDPKAET